MKKSLRLIVALSAVLVATPSCSNGAKEQYETQKAHVDSLHKANEQAINGAMLTGSPAEALNVKLKAYHAEVEALDSLTNFAKEAFGDNSAEYKEAYDQKSKAKQQEEQATSGAIESINNFTN